MEAILVAIVGVAGAAIGAGLNGWIGARQKVADELRERRLLAYPSVWNRTSVISRWPRTDAGRAHLARLHDDLRTWYYAGGGMYLSENARARYGDLQNLLEAYAAEQGSTDTITRTCLRGRHGRGQ
ncbi:MAG TPA: hypothetical protein VE442_04275 [Jatrophihabitans sp.]|jgi:hypothetical protein|nr:hypothetical protein [Jatrophihabitans sp.]